MDKRNIKAKEYFDQAFGSKNHHKNHSTFSEIVYFSLSVPKIIKSGHGVFLSLGSHHKISDIRKVINYKNNFLF